MRRTFQALGLLLSFTIFLNAETKVTEIQEPASPFSLHLIAAPEKLLEQDPGIKLQGKDKVIVKAAREMRKYSRKQCSKWFVLADTPAAAEIVLELAERAEAKRAREISIKGTLKILDLYDGPVASSYKYSDTGSLTGVEKGRNSAKQLVEYLRQICEYNLDLLEERREFFLGVRKGEIEDVHDMWKQLLEVEDKVLNAHNRVIHLSKKSGISDADAADSLQREVLQPWKESIKLFSQMRVHESQQKLLSSILSYMKIRKEGWKLLVSAYRNGDDEKLVAANTKQKEAQRANAIIQGRLAERPRLIM